MLWVYGHYNYFHSYSVGPALVVRIWRLQMSESDSKVGPRAVRVRESELNRDFGSLILCFKAAASFCFTES